MFEHNLHLKSVIYREKFFTKDECEKIISLIPQYEVEGRYNEPENGTRMTYYNAKELNRWAEKKILDSARIINSIHYKFDITAVFDILVTEYFENDCMNWHIDLGASPESSLRKLSAIVFLSDKNDYQGGELLWVPGKPTNFGFNQEQGGIVFFPAYMDHKVTTVTKGKRHSLLAAIIGSKPFK